MGWRIGQDWAEASPLDRMYRHHDIVAHRWLLNQLLDGLGR